MDWRGELFMRSWCYFGVFLRVAKKQLKKTHQNNILVMAWTVRHYSNLHKSVLLHDMNSLKVAIKKTTFRHGLQAPVPLSIFRSNSKFDENSERSSFEYTRPITTIFCTSHDSDTVVTCAKYRCDRPRIFCTRVFWIFIEFRIRSKYALWDGRHVSLNR